MTHRLHHPLHVITRLVRVTQPNASPPQLRTGFGMGGPDKPGHDVDLIKRPA